MACIRYKKKNFRKATLDIIAKANEVCEDFAQQGYDLTLRQLYYQFVSRDWIPNTTQSYNNLGSMVNDARLAGLLDWDYLVDRGRYSVSRNHYDSPGAIIDVTSRAYNRDLWASQPVRVEVWVEKDALSGVMEPVCAEFDVRSFACKGYTSQSEMWAAGQRIGKYIEGGQHVVILHLGDHDPSGIDMTRDIAERLDLFTATDFYANHDEGDARFVDIRLAMAEHCNRDVEGYAGWSPGKEDGGALEVRRIALTMAQIEEYDPPPNPAKTTDARYEGYAALYGEESWELDALNPATLSALVREHVESLIEDAAAWEIANEAEESGRELLGKASRRWSEVVELLEGDAA